MKTLPLSEAKAKLSGLIDEVAKRDERITITKRGRPTAVLMSHSEAEGLDATLEIMSDPEFYAEVLRNGRALELGEGRWYTLDELFGEEVRTPAPTARRGASRRRRGDKATATGPKEKGPSGARGARRRSRSR